MTQTEFNHLLSQIKAMPPEQMRRLRQQLDRQLAAPARPLADPPARTAAKASRRAKAAPQPAKKPMTRAEFDQHLLEIGLLSQLPDTEADFDDPDDVPVEIKGEPLSETIIRERR
jgi:hypothetical protein